MTSEVDLCSKEVEISTIVWNTTVTQVEEYLFILFVWYFSLSLPAPLKLIKLTTVYYTDSAALTLQRQKPVAKQHYVHASVGWESLHKEVNVAEILTMISEHYISAAFWLVHLWNIYACDMYVYILHNTSPTGEIWNQADACDWFIYRVCDLIMTVYSTYMYCIRLLP